MSLRLRLRPGSLPAGTRVDAATLAPDRFAGLDVAAAARLVLPTSTGDARLGDLFAVDADPGPDDALVVDGDLDRFHRIGAAMRAGALHLRGAAGPHAGSGMRGGRLTIEGDAGERAGEGMRGGILLIGGSAGDHAGAPLPGHADGQSGGVLVVRGRAGTGAGFRMRRGLLALGAPGGAVGGAMIAGTIVIFEAPGPGAGAMMRRGTLVALRPFEPGASFARSGRSGAPWLLPYWDALRAAGMPVPEAIAAASFRHFRGDLAEGALGEILMHEEVR